MSEQNNIKTGLGDDYDTRYLWKQISDLDGGGVAQLVERLACNRKVTKPWFDSRCGSASLCPWEKQ